MGLRGVLLAGGSGSRLSPLTRVTNKHLLPIYDKPLIYYPLCTLMLAGVRDIMLVSGPEDIAAFKGLLGDGERFGVSIHYAVQDKPSGLADALLAARDFVGTSPSMLVLGDNLFHGPMLGTSLAARASSSRATVFAYAVSNPSDYAVVILDADGRPTSIVEKPTEPSGSLAVPGMYFFPPGVMTIAEAVPIGPRGEREITDVNREYLRQGRLDVVELPLGTAWLDAGSPDRLHDASTYVRVLQERQGTVICAPEEVAWRQEWLTDESLRAVAIENGSPSYRNHLLSLTQST